MAEKESNEYTVEQLIEQLKKFNPKAKTSVIAHCREYRYTISAGGPDGTTDKTAETVSFYVDHLCTNEQSK